MEYTLDDVVNELYAAFDAMKGAVEVHSRTRIEDAVNWITAILNEHRGGPYEHTLRRLYDEFIESTFG